MDAETFAAAMGRSLPLSRYQALLPAWNAALIQAGCTTVNRVAMWCAQVGHESVGLKYMQEIASGAAYEGRKDLGNTQPGDGRRFKGHGPLQITGRANHAAVSKWAHSKGYVPTPTYFVDHPLELTGDRYGFMGVVWYWSSARPRLNSYADAGDIVAATKAVNGGLNGLADRTARWSRCRALGNRLLPTPPEEDFMAQVKPEEWAKVYRQSSAAFPYDKHHGAVTDDQLGHVLSIRKELAELRKAVEELAERLGKE